MMKKIPSPNFDARKAAVDMLVLHYTGRPTLEESLAWLIDPAKKVSAHYLIGEKGEVFQLVAENKRAWHAGVSYWRGETDINSCSIGIELQNPGQEFGYRDFSKSQIRSLIKLSKEIIARHKIPAGRILGHSDVAPSRKFDPGEKFPWAELGEKGVGLWPKNYNPESLKGRFAREPFLRFGYDPDVSFASVVRAFQRHWRPENISGVADEETIGRLKAML